MTSGGARLRSGPPPETDAQGHPIAIRRGKNPETGWIRLPAEGRQGEPPTWPLVRPTRRELGLWEDLWRTSQAIRWEMDRLWIQVAMYVRVLARAERPRATSSDIKEEHARANALGLTSDGLAKNHWIIDGTIEARSASVDGPPGELIDWASEKARMGVG